jgi:hypothetical protein
VSGRVGREGPRSHRADRRVTIGSRDEEPALYTREFLRACLMHLTGG